MKRVASRRADGQASAEYLGAMVLVGITIAAILVMNPGISALIAHGIETAVCRIMGKSCDSRIVAPANPFLPTTPCTRESAGAKVGLDVTVFSIKAGGSLEGRREARSDGTVAVTLQSSGRLGAELGLGAEGTVKLGEKLFGEGGTAEASLTGELTGARTWIFPNADEADTFINDVKAWAIENATATGIRIGGGPVGGLIGETFYRNVIAGHDDFRFPDANETFFKGGIKLAGSAGASHATSYVDVEAAAEGALGGKINHRTGDITLFYQVTLEGEGSAGLNIVAGGGVAGKGTALVALVLDRDGNPKSLALTGTGTGSAEFQNVGSWKSFDDITKGLKEATLSAAEADNHTWELEARLRLDNDPEARAAAMNWLASHLGGTNPAINPEFARASIALVKELDSKGVITVKEYDGKKSTYGAEAKAALGVKFAGGAELEQTNAHLTSAKYRQPGVGFLDIPNCVG